MKFKNLSLEDPPPDYEEGVSERRTCTRCDRERPVSQLRSCAAPSCGEETRLCVDLCEDPDCTETARCEGDCKTCWEAHLPRARTIRPNHSQVSVEMIMHFRQVMGLQINQHNANSYHFKDLDTTWIYVREGAGGRMSLALSKTLQSYMAISAGSQVQESPEPGGEESNLTRFPSLVSFIGATGAGKSTLIRALIALSQLNDSTLFPLPVPAATDSIGKPTSSNVHLYRDPDTVHSLSPIFFVDSEGLDAGEETPVSQGAVEGQERGLAATLMEVALDYYTLGFFNQEKPRSSIVEEVFPRFLYTFSDVVCFVVGNDQTIGRDIVRLVLWARTGMSSSVNQPALPSLILILNYVKNMSSKPEDPALLVDKMMESVEKLIHNDKCLSDIARELDPKGASLQTTQDLLLVYFSRIRAFPVYGLDTTSGGTPKVLSQCRRLRRQICSDVQTIQDARANSRRQFDVDQLGFLMEKATHHFSFGSKKAFDVYEQFGSQCHDPKTVADHIDEFLLSTKGLHAVPETSLPVTGILGRHIAYGLCADFIRKHRNYVFTLEDFKKSYEDHIRDGYRQFRAADTCTFSDPDSGSQCRSRREFHGDIHRFDNGRSLIGVFRGPPADTLWWTFIQEVYSFLKEAVQCASSKGLNVFLETHNQCLRDVATNFRTIYSIKTCLICLSATPVHQIPCRHGFCDDCLKVRSNCSKDGTVLHLAKCPLCQLESPTESWPWVKILKPPSAGCRILSLDGGGIRGIVQLITLRILEQELGLGIPLARYFDLIVGTGTGGLVAVGLYEGKSIDSMIESFATLCKDVFERSQYKVFDYIVVGSVAHWICNWAKYDSNIMKAKLAGILEDCGARSMHDHPHPKNVSANLVLTTVKSSNLETNLITNYNRAKTGERWPILRLSTPDGDMSCLQAVMAATASPGYFKPVQYGPSQYIDGGSKFSCPAEVALVESGLIWPQTHSLDMLLSIGTGVYGGSETSTAIPDNWSQGRWQQLAGLGEFEPNVMYEKFSKRYMETHTGRLRRLNLDTKDCGPPRADDCSKIGILTKLVLEDKLLEEYIKETSILLLSSLFYFVPSSRSYTFKYGYRIDGYIRCRLCVEESGEHEALRKLIPRILFFGERIVRLNGPHVLRLPGSQDWSDSIGEHGMSFKCSLEAADSKKDYFLAAAFEAERTGSGLRVTPISGFPCSFADIDRTQFDIQSLDDSDLPRDTRLVTNLQGVL